MITSCDVYLSQNVLTAFRRQINQVYIWHQILVSWKGLILFRVFLLLPKNMLWKLTGWSLTMVEVDCQSFSGVPFLKKIQAHNTSQRLYLDYIPKRQIMLQTCRDFVYYVWHVGTKFCPYRLCIFNLLCRFPSNFIQGRAYTFCRAVSIHFCL